MITLSKVLFWASCLLALIFLGSLGYVLLEGWSFFDGLYMTVTTLTTVGYGEIRPLTQMGRAYTMLLILAGVGVMLYIIGAVAQVVVEGEIQEALGKRKLRKHLKKLKDHYIICGFGRIGEIIARQLKQRGVPLVVVESDEHRLSRLEEGDYFFVAGDATREEMLVEAGIDRAKGLVAVVGTDAGNVYVTLTARSLNPRLFIVSRSAEPGSRQKLLRAGADRVESPYEVGGGKMAQTILRPNVTTFIELALREDVDLSMEEIQVKHDCPLCGLALKDSGLRQQLDLIVVAIKRADGEMLFNPTPETRILAEDTLIVLGLRQNLEKMEAMLG